ncbi:MAG: hypothetical protein HYZ01_09395 [Ignavibacteriales bacterium]|nr:hypothetical protein [Ignavibacteriales bacterium]
MRVRKVFWLALGGILLAVSCRDYAVEESGTQALMFGAGGTVSFRIDSLTYRSDRSFARQTSSFMDGLLQTELNSGDSKAFFEISFRVGRSDSLLSIARCVLRLGPVDNDGLFYQFPGNESGFSPNLRLTRDRTIVGSFSAKLAGTGGTFGTEISLRNGTINIPFRQN